MSDLTLLINQFNVGPSQQAQLMNSQSIDNILHDNGLESSDSSIPDTLNLKSSAVEVANNRRSSKTQRETDLFNFSDIGDDSDALATEIAADDVPATINLNFNQLKLTKPVKISDIFAEEELTRENIVSEPTIVMPVIQDDPTLIVPEEVESTVIAEEKPQKANKRQKKPKEKSSKSESSSDGQRTKKKRSKDRKLENYSDNDHPYEGQGEQEPTDNRWDSEQAAQSLQESSFEEYVELVDAKRQTREVNIVEAGRVKREITPKEDQIITVKPLNKGKQANDIQFNPEEDKMKEEEDDLLQSSVEVEQISKPILRKRGQQRQENNVSVEPLEQSTKESRAQSVKSQRAASEEQSNEQELYNSDISVAREESPSEPPKQSNIADFVPPMEHLLSTVKSGPGGLSEQPASSLSVPQPEGSNPTGDILDHELSMNDLDNFANSVHSDTVSIKKPTRKPSTSLSLSGEPQNKPSMSVDESSEFLESEPSGAASATFSAQDTAMSQSILQEYEGLYDSKPRKEMLSTQIVEQSFLEQRNPLLFYFQKHDLTHLLGGNQLADYGSKHVEYFDLSLDNIQLPTNYRGVIEPPVRRILGERVIKQNSRITGLHILVLQQKKVDSMSKIGRLACRKSINAPETIRAAETAGIQVSELKELNFGQKPHVAGIFAAGDLDLKMGVLRSGERFSQRRSRTRIVFLVIQGQIRVNNVSVRAWESCYVNQSTDFVVIGEGIQSIFWIFE